MNTRSQQSVTGIHNLESLFLLFEEKHMKEYQLVLFDVDGILFNTEHIYLDAYNTIGNRHGIRELNGELFQKTVGISGKDTEKLFDRLLGHREDRMELLKEIRAYGKQKIDEELNMLEGAEEMLQYWQKRGVPIAAATSTIRSLTDERFSRMNITKYFSCIVCGDEVTRKKPDPEIYQTVMKKTGVESSRTLVFEDTGYGVRAACAAGADCILVPSVTIPAEEEKAMAVYTAEDMHDAISFLEQQNS